MITHRRRKGEAQGEERDCCDEGRHQHASGKGGPDENAIPNEGCLARHRDEHRPRQIGYRRQNYLGISRQQAKQQRSAQPIEQRED